MCLLCEVMRRYRFTVSHRGIETELVADYGERDTHRRCTIRDHFADKRAGLLGVELYGICHCLLLLCTHDDLFYAPASMCSGQSLAHPEFTMRISGVMRSAHAYFTAVFAK